MALGRALVVVAFGASVAAATPALDRAHAALDRSDYVAARAALDDALAAGTNRPDELVEVYRLRGVVAGALDDRDGARDAFARMLALHPTSGFPAGTSPKTTVPFEAAITQLAGARLVVALETTHEPPSTTLVVASDPLHMVARGRLAIVVDGRPIAARAIEVGARIALPAGMRIEVRGEALDERGNALVELPPAVIAAAPVVTLAPVPERREPPVYARWYVYGGAAAAFALAGTAFALAARSTQHDLQAIVDDSSHHTYAEAQDVASRGRRDTTLANLGVGTAGALAITAAILFALHRHEHASVVVTPTSVALGGRF